MPATCRIVNSYFVNFTDLCTWWRSPFKRPSYVNMEPIDFRLKLKPIIARYSSLYQRYPKGKGLVGVYPRMIWYALGRSSTEIFVFTTVGLPPRKMTAQKLCLRCRLSRKGSSSGLGRWSWNRIANSIILLFSSSSRERYGPMQLLCSFLAFWLRGNTIPRKNCWHS